MSLGLRSECVKTIEESGRRESGKASLYHLSRSDAVVRMRNLQNA